MKTKLQNMSLKGRYKITVAKVDTVEAREQMDYIDNLFKQGGNADLAKQKLKLFNEKFGVRTLELENVTCDVGRGIIAQALSGNISAVADIQCNDIALGDDATAPTSSDTTLGNETFRKALSSVTYTDNIFYATGFLTASEGVDTHEELGLFINGDQTTDSGSLLSHLALSSLVKSGTETLTIEVQISINDA